MRLKEKVCVITGSSRGIGKAIAHGFAREGAEVVITYVKHKKMAQQVGKEIDAKLILRLDVRDRTSIRKAFRRIAKEYGHIDVLINNAGINYPADFDKQTDKEWNEVIDTNLTGVFRCCQEVLPYIADYGRIINIGSLSGEYGGPRTPSYACAKMGVMALTHNLARFLGPRNICVNTLSPGVIESDMTKRTMTPKVRRMVFALSILKRFGRYDELVGAAIYLASDESSFMTAQTISVNGGAWVH
jgi:3-oxoacyl-[acyl-carrier protein] reductase